LWPRPRSLQEALMIVLKSTQMTKYSERARRELVSVVELIVLAFVIRIPVAVPLMLARAAPAQNQAQRFRYT
jgi:hypothetical protein